MKRKIIKLANVLLFTLLTYNSYAQLKACIKLGSSASYPIVGDTAYFCKGTSINLIASNCAGTTNPSQEQYSWVNLSNPTLTSEAQNFFTPDTGRWEVTLTNITNFQEDKEVIYIKYFTTPIFFVNGDKIIESACLYDNITLTTNNPVNTTNYQWFVENNNSPVWSSNTPFIFKSKDIPGVGSAYYTATAVYSGTYSQGPFQCLLADTILVIAKQTPSVTLQNDTSLCAGQSITLLAKVNILPDNSPANVKNISFQWNAGNIQLGVDTFTTSPATSSKKYFVTVKNSLNCISSDTMVINIKPGLSVIAGATSSVCSGSTVNLDVNTTGGAGGYQYQWYPATDLTNSTVKSPAATVWSATTYHVQVKDKNGCTGSTAQTVNITPGLTVNITKDTTICTGANIILNATVVGTSNYTYTWSPNASLDNDSKQSPTATPQTSTTYTVIAVDQNGCKGKATSTISTNPAIIINPAFTDSTTAQLDTIQINSSISGGYGTYTYNWTPPSPIDKTNDAILDVNPSKNTTYTLTVTDQNKCSAQASVFIDKLWVDLGGADTSGFIGDSLKLNAFNETQKGFDYKWVDSTGNIISQKDVYFAKTPGLYKVYVFNPVTLSFVVDSQRVAFEKRYTPVVLVPNVFSPSMLNDADKNLRVYGSNISNQNFSFQVYNNWGQMVYEADSFIEANEKGWNGSVKNNGQDVSLGVYTYTVKGEFKDGTKFNKTGTASLIK